MQEKVFKPLLTKTATRVKVTTDILTSKVHSCFTRGSLAVHSRFTRGSPAVHSWLTRGSLLGVLWFAVCVRAWCVLGVLGACCVLLWLPVMCVLGVLGVLGACLARSVLLCVAWLACLVRAWCVPGALRCPVCSVLFDRLFFRHSLFSRYLARLRNPESVPPLLFPAARCAS